MTLAIAHSRGWLDYEERVGKYRPSSPSTANRITVRQLLAHQAGLFAFDAPFAAVVADLDRLAVVMARQRPAWEPGTRQAYHGLTLGFYEGELLRRVIRSIPPWGSSFRTRSPRLSARTSTSGCPKRFAMLGWRHLHRRDQSRCCSGSAPSGSWSRDGSAFEHLRALAMIPGSPLYLDEQRVYTRNLEVPAGGGIGTARGMAHAYGVSRQEDGTRASKGDAGRAGRASFPRCEASSTNA